MTADADRLSGEWLQLNLKMAGVRLSLRIGAKANSWSKSVRLIAGVCTCLLASGCSSSLSSSGQVISRLSAGLAAQARGDYATASADYLSVLASQPGNYIAWYDLGVIAGHDGGAAQAAHDYSEAIAANPNYVPALYNLAVTDTASDPTRALSLYRRIVVLQPDDAEALFNEGLLLESTGQAALGRQDVVKAVDLDPSLGQKG